ncbi:aminoglycoside phosphotransferase family protein [Micromonospora chersina]|uniref:aminoglycoside phosphotransferase family protein n=1 Tax=Micromonospora chersina TaxID=47854 RepID=UPI0033BA32EF
MPAWDDLTRVELRNACERGELIAEGELNTTYRAMLRGRRVFVRIRTVQDAEFGQTFAAERHVYGLVDGVIRVPRLLALDPSAAPAYAVFEYVESVPTRWNAAATLVGLAELLARLHRVPGPGLGPVDAPGGSTDAAAVLHGLALAELDRVRAAVGDELNVGPMHAWVNEFPRIFAGEPVVLCHGDVHAGNVLTGGDGEL